MRYAVAALAACAVLTGCTSGDSADKARDTSASPTTTSSAAAPAPAAPRNGACYRLGLDDAARTTSDARPVSCRSRHTAQTIHVGRLRTVVQGHSLSVTSAVAQRQLVRTCRSRLAAHVGGDAETRELSRFQVVWFIPTPAQSDEGATWFRCDLVAFGRSDRLMPLPPPARLRKVLDRPGALATYGLCGTTQPGQPAFARVACGLPHRWVAIGTIPIGGTSYPGAAAVRAAGDQQCADEVRERSGFALEYTYGWEWPTRAQWASGQRYGFCWAPAG